MTFRVRLGDDKGSLVTFVLLAIALGLLWYVTTYSRPITNAPTPTPDTNTAVVAFGGSLGSRAGALSNQSYVDILSTNTHTTILNHAELGETAADTRKRADSIAALQPRITILEFGFNDTTDPNQFRAHLEQTVETLHQSGSAVIIVELPGHGTIYRDVARTHQTAYVPNVMVGLPGNDEYMFDEIHPNDEGHKKIAERIEPVLFELLTQ